MQFLKNIISLLTLYSLTICCANQKILHPSPKIGFDVNAIDKEGLVGESGAKVALNYEFCIPADNSFIGKVRQVDPSVKVHRKSKGRIGCSKKEWLCIGNSHQENAKWKIQSLAEYGFIRRIERTYFE